VDPAQRTQAIKDLLRDRIETTHVEVTDLSARHASHQGAQSGGGHFSLVVVAESFRGLDRISAQRLVFTALEELMASDIHAITMRTLTPEQWSDEIG
jgi:BolA protein